MLKRLFRKKTFIMNREEPPTPPPPPESESVSNNCNDNLTFSNTSCMILNIFNSF